MLRILSNRHQAANCEGAPNRREFLRVGALGLGGLALPQLFAARAGAREATRYLTGKSVVMLNLQGWTDAEIWSGDLPTETDTDERRTVGLKGIHLAVRLPSALRDHGMMAINRINEPIYCLPWNGMHYIGPTRTPYDGDLDDVVATADEMDGGRQGGLKRRNR